MSDCLFAWLSEIEWNLKLFESWMRGNEMTFPNFHPCIYDLHEFKIIQTQNPRVKMTWLLPFEMERVWKDLNFTWKYFKLKALCNSMIFMREDKMTSSIIWNMSWKLKRIKLKVIWKYFETPLQIWNYLDFVQIIFLLKINKWEWG